MTKKPIQNQKIYEIKGAWEDNVSIQDGLLHIKGSKTPLTGTLVAYNKNKSLRYRSTYKKGIGLKTEWFGYKGGLLEWSSEHGEARDYFEHLSYFKNGQLKERWFCFNENEGTTHGFCEEYYDNGVLAAKGNFLKSRVSEKHGLWKLFNKKGKLMFSVYLDKGKLREVIPGNFIKHEDGLIYELKNNHPKEKPYTGVMYIHMQRVSIFESSPKFGKDQVELKLRIPYKNGLKHGVYVEFQDTGGEGCFLDHYRRSYYCSGAAMDAAVKYAINVKELMPAYISKEDHQNFGLKVRQHYKNGLREGLCEEFYQNGICESSIMYKKDKLNGIWQEKHYNGVTTFVGYFRDGRPSGLISQWEHKEGFRADWKFLQASQWTWKDTVNTNYDDNCHDFEEYRLLKKEEVLNEIYR